MDKKHWDKSNFLWILLLIFSFIAAGLLRWMCPHQTQTWWGLFGVILSLGAYSAISLLIPDLFAKISSSQEAVLHITLVIFVVNLLFSMAGLGIALWGTGVTTEVGNMTGNESLNLAHQLLGLSNGYFDCVYFLGGILVGALISFTLRTLTSRPKTQKQEEAASDNAKLDTIITKLNKLDKIDDLTSAVNKLSQPIQMPKTKKTTKSGRKQAKKETKDASNQDKSR